MYPYREGNLNLISTCFKEYMLSLTIIFGFVVILAHTGSNHRSIVLAVSTTGMYLLTSEH